MRHKIPNFDTGILWLHCVPEKEEFQHARLQDTVTEKTPAVGTSHHNLYVPFHHSNRV